MGLLRGRKIVLAVGRVELIGRYIAFEMSEVFLWTELIGFQRCLTTNIGFQVFFSLG